MKNLLNKLEKLFPFESKAILPLPPGMYQNNPEDSPHKMHLRLEADGSGVLIIDARTALHLNQTAAEFAYYLVHGASRETTLEQMESRYKVKSEQLADDYQQLLDTIQTLSTTEDLDPEGFFFVDRTDPYSRNLSAPYRLDCALTYRQNDEAERNTTPEDRVKRELLTEEWQSILKKAWEAGIPHIVFTGGEPTLRPDLPELVAFAEANGQITGLLTDGFRLCDPDYLHKMLETGLDHVMVTLDPKEDQSWEAVLDTLKEDIFLTVHLTVMKKETDEYFSVMERLAKMGVRNLSLSGINADLLEAVRKCGDFATSRGISLVWDLPVPYSQFNPVSAELPSEQLRNGAGNAWLYLEPDGDVLPTQGVIKPLGNLLVDPWEKIWNNPLRKSDHME